jgi:acyl dehydratase
MRMIVEGYLSQAASLGSPGVDAVRWLKPVRPGDTLRARVRVVAVEPSRSKPDRGVMRSHGEMLNQRDEVVMSLEGMGMFLRRPPG